GRIDVAARRRSIRLRVLPLPGIGWAGFRWPRLRLARLGRAQLRRAELRLTDFGRRRLAGRLGELARRLGLHLADRFLEREPLARDVRLVERRRHPAQLRQQGRARALVERTAVLAAVLFETGDGAGDERIIVGHRL